MCECILLLERKDKTQAHSAVYMRSLVQTLSLNIAASKQDYQVFQPERSHLIAKLNSPSCEMELLDLEYSKTECLGCWVASVFDTHSLIHAIKLTGIYSFSIVQFQGAMSF